jgi:MFS family permease
MTAPVAALVMVATLPGRSQGLGLITEPMLRDLRLDRILYADINLWATLLGALFCLPAGWVFDRFGLRLPTTAILLLLGGVVWRMSAHTGSVAVFFLLVLLTRGLGQSALSVAGITAVGKGSARRVGLAMGVYSVLVSMLFGMAFKVVGGFVHGSGWRVAWSRVAAGLVLGVAPLVLLFFRDPVRSSAPRTEDPTLDTREGHDLAEALRSPAFWVFGGATALYGLVVSGLGLFNESVLAERGFSQETYHNFLAFTSVMGLVGQLLAAATSLRWTLQQLMSLAMFLYAAALGAFPMVGTLSGLWVLGTLMGVSGGVITVVFFAIWSHAFGRKRLGRIQGAAQMLTVLASAVGPLVFARCHARFHSYTPALWLLAPLVLFFAAAALRVRLPGKVPIAASELRPQAA